MPYKDKKRAQEQVGVRARERTKLLREIKNVPCFDCGQEYPYYVMDFDHARGVKIFNVGLMLTFSLQRFLDEVAKCDVVCSNCHRIRTFTRTGSSTGGTADS